MLPTRPEPKASQVRELLERLGSELFDDEDPEEQGLIPARRRDLETPRQRYVRDMETRWAEFHQAEAGDGEGLIGLIFYWLVYLIPLAIVVALSAARWLTHFSAATQWKVGGGLSLMYIAWLLWRRTRPKKENDD